MAIGDPYFDKDDLKNLLGITSTDEDDLIDRVCRGASRALERRSGWPTFWKTTGPEARRISVVNRVVSVRRSGYSYTKVLLRDGIASAAGFSVASYPTAALYPPDALDQGEPADEIKLPIGATFGNDGELAVTAQWGWPEVPSDIFMAAQLQSHRFYQRKGSPEGAAGSAEWGITRIPALDPDVLSILKGGGYMRAGIG